MIFIREFDIIMKSSAITGLVENLLLGSVPPDRNSLQKSLQELYASSSTISSCDVVVISFLILLVLLLTNNLINLLNCISRLLFV